MSVKVSVLSPSTPHRGRDSFAELASARYARRRRAHRRARHQHRATFLAVGLGEGPRPRRVPRRVVGEGRAPPGAWPAGCVVARYTTAEAVDDPGSPTPPVQVTRSWPCLTDTACARSTSLRMRRDRIAKLRRRWKPPASTCSSVRPEQRLVRDRRARRRPPTTCARRGGARSRCSSGATTGRTSSPSSPRARRPRSRRVLHPAIEVETAHGARRARRHAPGRRARARRRAVPAVDRAARTAGRSTRAWCSAPAKLTKTARRARMHPPDRRAHQRAGDAARSAPLAVPGARATDCPGAFLARDRRARARPPTPSTRCSR